MNFGPRFLDEAWSRKAVIPLHVSVSCTNVTWVHSCRMDCMNAGASITLQFPRVAFENMLKKRNRNMDRIFGRNMVVPKKPAYFDLVVTCVYSIYVQEDDIHLYIIYVYI